MTDLDSGTNDDCRRTVRCRLCKTDFTIDKPADYGAALDHAASDHPEWDVLHEVLEDTAIEAECADCGETFVADLSESPESGAVVRRSVCDSCGMDSHLQARKLLVEPVGGRAAVRREVMKR